jgi:hypothetical protein
MPPPPPFIPCLPQIFGGAPPLRRLSRHDQAPPRPRRLLPPVLDAGAHRPALLPPRCLLCVNPLAHISQHGLRTFFAGPQSLWNPDISANDWLMQVRASRSFRCRRRCQPRAAGVKFELLRIFCPQSGVRPPLRPRRRRKLQGAVAAIQAAEAGEQRVMCSAPPLPPVSSQPLQLAAENELLKRRVPRSPPPAACCLYM